MDLFSFRTGRKPVREVLQVEGMDEALRTGLWNVCFEHFWREAASSTWTPSGGYVAIFVRALWNRHLGLPLDMINRYWQRTYATIRERFMGCEWYEVYDFLEFATLHWPDHLAKEHARTPNPAFRSACNVVLAREMAGYRFVGAHVTPITAEEDMACVETALAGSLNVVRQHLDRAVALLSDRTQPDFRNSVKEAISAVEALCQRVTGDDSASLGAALKAMEKQGALALHGAFAGALQQLYGYTSNADGIRHALTDEPTVELEDALFMLVACSAFVNYLTAKAARAGLSLG